MQTTCGTEDYISPEMLDGDLYTDQIDMWALGIIMYAILCGHMPFNDQSRAKMYQKIKAGSYSMSSEVSEQESSYCTSGEPSETHEKCNTGSFTHFMNELVFLHALANRA